MIRTEKLSVGYGKKIVVSDIELSAVKGQVVCLLGPNGSGKSTILKTLAGLLSPVSGAVMIDGEDISIIGKKDISRKLALVLTEQPSPAMTTVYELVAVGRTPYTDLMGRLSQEDREIVDEAIETTGIAELRDRYMSELSDGEKQKVMIARAIVQQPEVIILDEPTSHLDIKYKLEVIRLLQRLSNERNITCILSLHDIDLAIKGCQTVMLVNDGKIVGIGSPEEIIKGGTICELYGLSGGEYNELIGSVELKAADRNDAFVVAGNGSGISIYRALARSGYGVASGVLHENDMDCEVAKRICGEVICEKAFEPIGADKTEKALNLAMAYSFAVDSGFPAGAGNVENITLLKSIIENDKPVYSLRPLNESKHIFGKLAGRITHANDVTKLLDIIEQSKYK